MNKLNFKRILVDNAKKIMINNINHNYIDKTEKAHDFNDKILESVEEEENSILTTRGFNFSIEELDEIRIPFSKKNYHFPDILNMGTLITQHKIPSEIYPKNDFRTEIPFIIPVQETGISFLINGKYKKEITHQLEQTVINMITSLPDGMVKVTLIDKSGSGQNFPLLGMLDKKFLDGKVLSEDSEIELSLEKLKNENGNVANNISANGFSSIEDYNRNSDEVEKRYQFLVIDDFPSGFNKKSSENILALIESGYKAGIYVFLTSKFDNKEKFNERVGNIPLGKFLARTTVLEFSDRNHSYVNDNIIETDIEVAIYPLKNESAYKNLVNSSYKIKLRRESVEELSSKIKYLNKKIELINLKPMILLESIIPNKSEWYSKNAGLGISVPFGKKGIENTYLNLGVDERGEVENVHHGVICGRTGSGKTVLIHDLIMMASIYYSPEELQFYLLDYKEGTEFALYKDFPQVKILSMESEVEFGHDVLEDAVNLITERGKLFKKWKVQKLAAYNNKIIQYNKDIDDGVIPGEKEKILPRLVIIIDEFQKLLPEDNQKLTATTNKLLTDISKRGRSFGINLLLATQTLQDADLKKSTLAQMNLRIGLAMEEKDAAKIFGDNNSAPRHLEFPGEGIYNNNSGESRNNLHFQACNIEDTRLVKLMDTVHSFMKENVDKDFYNDLVESRFIYNGENEGTISNLIEDKNENIYIGESIGLDTEHTYIRFNNDFGENLAMVGSSQIQATSTMLYIIEQILRKDKKSEFYFHNFSLPLQELFITETKTFDKERFFIGNNENSSESVDKVYEEFKRREENKIIDGNKIYLAFFYIESSKVLTDARKESRKRINEMMANAPEFGIHLIYYAIDHGTIREQGLTNDLNKFKNRIAFPGGNSEKILNAGDMKIVLPNNTKDKEVKIALMEKDYSQYKKFKPYINEKLKKYFKKGGTK